MFTSYMPDSVVIHRHRIFRLIIFFVLSHWANQATDSLSRSLTEHKWYHTTSSSELPFTCTSGRFLRCPGGISFPSFPFSSLLESKPTAMDPVHGQ